MDSEIRRFLGNACNIPGWNTIMNQKQVDEILQEYSDTLFCRGHLRKIKVDTICPNNYKVYTESI
jgi:hypothetical protein